MDNNKEITKEKIEEVFKKLFCGEPENKRRVKAFVYFESEEQARNWWNNTWTPLIEKEFNKRLNNESEADT